MSPIELVLILALVGYAVYRQTRVHELDLVLHPRQWGQPSPRGTGGGGHAPSSGHFDPARCTPGLLC